MKYKILLIALLFLLNNCGFKPIYSSKSISLQITEIIINEENTINLKVKNNLKNFSKNKSKNKFILKINSNKIINISSKDKKGDPKMFSMNIFVDVEIIKKDKSKINKKFAESFTYSNVSNKFNLSQYEKTIEKNLINKITENITAYLISL